MGGFKSVILKGDDRYMKTMSLIGGIDTYSLFKRYKSDILPEGRKVIFLNDNGYDMERQYANQFFTD